MNLQEARVVLRPRSAPEIFDLAVRWYLGVGRWLFVRLALIVLMPSLALCVLARYYAEWEWGGVWLLAIVLTTACHGVFVVASSQLLFDSTVTVRQVLRHFLGRIASYLATLLVTRFYLVLGAVSVVALPCVWARVAYVHETSLLEGQSPLAATRRSRGIGYGRVGQVIIVQIGKLAGLCAFIWLFESLGVTVLDFVLQAGRPFGSLETGGSFAALVGLHAGIPYVASVSFLDYIDRRTRRDGWDVQLRFLSMAAALRAEENRA